MKTRDEVIRALAKLTLEKEGELEIDDDAVVSESDENGAYVQAWAWVSFSGTPLTKDPDEIAERAAEPVPF